MTDETYNGYANRETWAFNLHWQNDQGLYNETLDYARGQDPSDLSDTLLGSMVVEYWVEWLAEYDPNLWELMRTDVGSFWRINHAEVGAAVRESLENES